MPFRLSLKRAALCLFCLGSRHFPGDLIFGFLVVRMALRIRQIKPHIRLRKVLRDVFALEEQPA